MSGSRPINGRFTVAVEAEALCRYPYCGITRMVTHQYGCLSTLQPAWRFCFFHRTDVPATVREALPFVEWHRIDIRGARWSQQCDTWMEIRLPWAASRIGADVLHCPANAGPRWGIPTVLSILDLIPVAAEPSAPHVQRWFRRLRAAAARARLVLTISAASRQEIVRLLGVPEDRIRLHALAPARLNSQTSIRCAEDQLPAHARSQSPYVLVFGSLRPNKNLLRVLQAWGSLSDAARQRHRLLVVGLSLAEHESLRHTVAGLGLQDQCELMGQISDDHLGHLLSSATALAYVSTMEGFGLPILEAFDVGTPVVTSDASSMPEVAGGAALLVDPHSVQEIAAALAQILGDPALREQLSARGRTRAAQFSWWQSSRQLRAVLQEAAGVQPLSEFDR